MTPAARKAEMLRLRLSLRITRYSDQEKAEAFLEGYEIGVQSGNLGTFS